METKTVQGGVCGSCGSPIARDTLRCIARCDAPGLSLEALRIACHGLMSEQDLRLVKEVLRRYNAYPAMHEALKSIEAERAARGYDSVDSIRTIARAALARAGEP